MDRPILMIITNSMLTFIFTGPEKESHNSISNSPTHGHYENWSYDKFMSTNFLELTMGEKMSRLYFNWYRCHSHHKKIIDANFIERENQIYM